MLRIANWSKHYETAETRKVVSLRWVPVPNKQGKGYAKLVRKHGAAGLGVWVAILQMASTRNRDERDGSLDYSVEDMSDVSRIPAESFVEVLPTLQEIGWLQGVTTESGCHPDDPGDSPGRRKEGRTEGRSEGTESKEENSPQPPKGGQERSLRPHIQIGDALALRIGSSVSECRRQVAALLGAGSSPDDLSRMVDLAKPDDRPWEWASRVQRERESGGAPVPSERECSGCFTISSGCSALALSEFRGALICESCAERIAHGEPVPGYPDEGTTTLRIAR